MLVESATVYMTSIIRIREAAETWVPYSAGELLPNQRAHAFGKKEPDSLAGERLCLPISHRQRRQASARVFSSQESRRISSDALELRSVASS